MTTEREFKQAKGIPEYCPECGDKIKQKIVFKGRGQYRNKRKSVNCEYCGWSDIIKTDREAAIQIGIHDNS